LQSLVRHLFNIWFKPVPENVPEFAQLKTISTPGSDITETVL